MDHVAPNTLQWQLIPVKNPKEKARD